MQSKQNFSALMLEDASILQNLYLWIPQTHFQTGGIIVTVFLKFMEFRTSWLNFQATKVLAVTCNGYVNKAHSLTIAVFIVYQQSFRLEIRRNLFDQEIADITELIMKHMWDQMPCKHDISAFKLNCMHVN